VRNAAELSGVLEGGAGTHPAGSGPHSGTAGSIATTLPHSKGACTEREAGDAGARRIAGDGAPSTSLSGWDVGVGGAGRVPGDMQDGFGKHMVWAHGEAQRSSQVSTSDGTSLEVPILSRPGCLDGTAAPSVSFWPWFATSTDVQRLAAGALAHRRCFCCCCINVRSPMPLCCTHDGAVWMLSSELWSFRHRSSWEALLVASTLCADRMHGSSSDLLTLLAKAESSLTSGTDPASSAAIVLALF
jgi:hypothetical protein